MYTCIYREREHIYIYIYIYGVCFPGAFEKAERVVTQWDRMVDGLKDTGNTANLPTNIVDFGGSTQA